MENSQLTIVDVRTREEFMGGNIEGSVNIPLQEIVEREAEVMALIQPVIFCCAAGARSGQATQYFKAKGLDCENGGSWLDVNERLSL
jgi:phage shock protein E